MPRCASSARHHAHPVAPRLAHRREPVLERRPRRRRDRRRARGPCGRRRRTTISTARIVRARDATAEPAQVSWSVSANTSTPRAPPRARRPRRAPRSRRSRSSGSAARSASQTLAYGSGHGREPRRAARSPRAGDRAAVRRLRAATCSTSTSSTAGSTSRTPRAPSPSSTCWSRISRAPTTALVPSRAPPRSTIRRAPTDARSCA